MMSRLKALLILIILSQIIIQPVVAEAVTLTLEAPDGTDVSIHRDDFGVPHISGESQTGVFYGQGVAVAQDRLTQMETNRRAATGTLAEIYGNAYIGYDQNTRKLFYTETERLAQFAAMPSDFRTMVTAYAAGINCYLDWMEDDPATYLPLPLAGLSIAPWSETDVVAVTQYLMRRFGEFGGEELSRLSELNAYGQAWFDLNRPINDPTAPTTISEWAQPATGRSWRSTPFFVEPAVESEIVRQQAVFDRLEKRLNLPPKFGSFAVQIAPEKSATGNAMLLGCPQMGEPTAGETNVVNEVELRCPQFHVGGMTVAGIPGVIIGHTEHYTWTLTSGISDNVDVYIETTQDASLSFYLFNQEWIAFTAIADTVYNHLGQPYPFAITRSVHGPVYATNLGANQAYTYKMTFWNAELEMAEAMYNMFTGETLAEFEIAITGIPVSFNIFYTGIDQIIKYWHVGWYQDRTDGVDPRLPHNGDGSEEWGGIRSFSSLPVAVDPAQNYFVNWNNKPVSWWDNGDNVPWIGWHPVNLINNYVAPHNAFSFDDLKGTPQAISSHGTYQQAVEFTTDQIIDENIVPPGQSDFVSMAGLPSPHVSDQWPLHTVWHFKDMRFGFDPSHAQELTPIVSNRIIESFSITTPFQPFSEIRYRLNRTASVRLEIFDISGREQRILQTGAVTGDQGIRWDGTDSDGLPLPSGLYLGRLVAGDETALRKLFLLR